jgi:ribonuclease HII
MILPTLTRERDLWNAGARRVAGVDEVGIGPLCAAVVAAAVILPPDLDEAELAGVRDSKTIHHPARREALAERIEAVAERVAVGAASPREIERLNVRGATALAMQRALRRLGDYEHALVDGKPLRGLSPERHTFLVGGDGQCLSIASASIVAKVLRDRLMRLLAARYPEYGWEHNAGYATVDHLAALRRLGPTPHHRQHYRPVLQLRLGDEF